jgi:hypothetical protein
LVFEGRRRGCGGGGGGGGNGCCAAAKSILATAIECGDGVGGT